MKAEKFSCKPAQLEAKYTGASMGVIYTGQEAKQILGPDLNYGEAFAYLFRRFGYPVYGWDDHKELVRYDLTTPMDGVILTINPHCSTSTSFGYLLRHDLNRRCNYEQFQPMIYRNKKFKKWAALKYRVIAFDGFYVSASKKEINRASAAWLMNKYKVIRYPANKNDVEEFWRYKTEQCDKLRAEYDRIEPRCGQINLWNWRELPDHSIAKQVTLAIRAAIKDLLTAVNIRDWYINIKGRVYNPEYDAVPPSNMAGMGYIYAADIFKKRGTNDPAG